VRPLGFPKKKLYTELVVSGSRTVQDMFDRMPKIVSVTWPKARPFWENYLCTCTAFPRRIYVPCTWSP